MAKKPAINTDRFIENARSGFGHYADITDMECLCLVISNLYRQNKDLRNFNEIMNQTLKEYTQKISTALES